MSVLVTQTAAPTGTPRVWGRRGRRGFLSGLIRNRKAVIGLVILLVFTVLAIAPQLFTSVRDPHKYAFEPFLGPSGAHLLGTTSHGEDIFAQLVYGTRQSLVIALVAGFFATVLSVLVGVSAAYLGGIADEALSLITNVFLVLPTFPL